MDVAPVDRHFADGARRQHVAVVVDHRHAVPRIGTPHAAGSRGPPELRVADDVVHLGLAEHLVDRDAERLAAPGEHGGADRLARAHHRPQAERVARARLRDGLHHHLQRGREQERAGDAVALHQFERAFGREAAARPDDRESEVQRRQQRVHQAAGPGPVGRRPEDVALLRKPVLRRHEAGQVADQRAVRHQRALRGAGRAAGVDQQRRILGQRRHEREAVAGLRQQRAPRVAFAVALADDDQVLQRGTVRADRRERGQGAGVDDRDDGVAVLQAVLERVGPEQQRQRHRHRAHLVDGHVRHDGLGALRQDDRDAVTGLHAERLQRVGEAVGVGLQRGVGVRAAVARLVLVVQRDARGLLRPAPAARLGDVELARDVPAEVVVQRAILVPHRSLASGRHGFL